MTPLEQLYFEVEALVNSKEHVFDVLKQVMEGPHCHLGVHELSDVGVFRMKQGQMIFGTRQGCSLCEFKTEARY